MKITSAKVLDVRVPTSDNMLGSDPFHKAPDYSSAVLHLETDGGLRGVSVVFTVGAGTDWIGSWHRRPRDLGRRVYFRRVLRSPGQALPKAE